LVNIVTSSRLTPESADAAIQEVSRHFYEQNKAFGWVVGPSATPDDLGVRLASAGLSKMFDAAGMTLTDLNIPLRTNPAVSIREVTPEEMAMAITTMAEAFPAPEDAVRLMYEVLFRHRDSLNPHIYLAFLEGVEAPVGCSSMEFIPGRPIVHLRGAATMKAHRGKAIYTTLLAHRIADAREHGAEAAVIQAVKTTSAPICRRLGFTEICNLEFYTWSPEA
jgi:GNAT superfamily N-acetyltransferase